MNAKEEKKKDGGDIQTNLMLKQDKIVSSWLWLNVLNMTESEMNYIIKEASMKGVNIILLDISDYIDIIESGKKNVDFIFQNKIKYFLEESRRNNIKVEALIANKNWADSKYRYIPAKIFQFVVNFNNNKENRENKIMFSGVHFDIEVYSQKEYKKNKQKYLVNYLKLIKRIQKVENVSELSDDFTISFDVPYTFMGENKKIPKVFYNKKNKYIFEHMVDIMENKKKYNIFIMAYRRNFFGHNGSLFIINNYLNYFKKNDINIGFYLGFEVSEAKEKTVTFYGYKENDLSSEINNSVEFLKEYKNFKGIAIHDLESFLEM